MAFSPACVYLRTRKVRRAAGAQQIDRGIHNGLVSKTKKSTQRHSPRRIMMTLDCKNISSMKIMEKRLNLSRNLATCLSLSG